MGEGGGGVGMFWGLFGVGIKFAVWTRRFID